MQKKENPFTDREIKILTGVFRKLGSKHKVDGSYVRKIAIGKRATKTEKAKAILGSLKQTLELLKPAN